MYKFSSLPSTYYTVSGLQVGVKIAGCRGEGENMYLRAFVWEGNFFRKLESCSARDERKT